MKSLSNTASGQARSFDGGEAVRSGLPILGTGVLIWILSGGFPPTTWVFLFQTISQLNRLLATQGTAAIVPLTILIVQSLFLAAAWGLLGWIILREGAYLVTMQSKAELDRLLAFQSSTDELINPSQILQLPKQGFDMTTDQLMHGHVLDPTTEQLEKAQNFSVTTGPLRRGKDFGVMASPSREQEPEKEVSWASRSIQLPMPSAQSSSINSRNLQPSHAESRNAQSASVEARNGQSRNAQSASVEARNGQSRNAQSASVEARNGQSRNAQSASVEARNGQSRNAQSASVEARNGQSRNAQSASVEARNGQSRNAQSASVEARNGQSRNAQSASVEARNGQPRNAQSASVEARNGQSRNAQSASVEARNGQLRNRQPASAESRRTLHLRQGLSPRNLRKENSLENPFDKEVPLTSDAPVSGRRGRIEKIVEEEVELVAEEEAEEEVEEEVEDSPFVFGNPFDGPLPEVFKYDADLRRSVPELAEEGKTGSNGSKAKGR